MIITWVCCTSGDGTLQLMLLRGVIRMLDGWLRGWPVWRLITRFECCVYRVIVGVVCFLSSLGGDSLLWRFGR